MPHPDKVTGQQAHDHTRVPFIFVALLVVVLLGVTGLSVPVFAKTAVLREVRMGNHGEYIRVVFEFSAAVQYELTENEDTGSVSIRFLDTTSELNGAPISDTLDCINTVSAVQVGGHIITDISFDSKNVKLNPFTIQGPDRMVLDVFCTPEPVVEPELTEPPNISPTPMAVAEPVLAETRDSLPAPMAVAKPEMTEIRDTLPAPDTVAEPDHKKPVAPPTKIVEVAEVPSVVPKQGDASQQYLLLLLAAITGIIVLLIAVIIFQKRSLTEDPSAGQPDAIRDTEDMMHAIDTKIKEKLMKDDE
jgi:hypothetical protein